MAYTYDPTTGRAVLQQAPQQAPGALSGGGGMPWGDMLTSLGSGLLSGGSLAQGLGMGAQNFLAQKVARERQAREDYWKQQALGMDQRRLDQDQSQFKDSQALQRELPGIQSGFRVEEAKFGHGLDLDKLGVQHGNAMTLQAEQDGAAMSRVRANAAAAAAQARLSGDLDLRNTLEALKYKTAHPMSGSRLSGSFQKMEPIEMSDGTMKYPVFNDETGQINYVDAPTGATRAVDGSQGERNIYDEKNVRGPIIDAGNAAGMEAQTVDRLLDLTKVAERDGSYFGPGAEGLLTVKKLLVEAGVVGGDSVSTLEQAVNLAGDRMLQQMQRLGGNDSNEELRRIATMGWTPGDTLQGNVEKLKQMRAGLQYLQQKKDFFNAPENRDRRTRDVLADWDKSREGKHIYEGLRGDGAASGNRTKTGTSWRIVQ
jgi:hypothetical protein